MALGDRAEGRPTLEGLGPAFLPPSFISPPLQDISAENADRLHALCRTVVDEGPRVFVPLPEEKENRHFQEEVPVYVPKWMMFQELMLVLQASLQEIVDR